jgi:RNA polymerase sigma-70 factor (ECF subfamily)
MAIVDEIEAAIPALRRYARALAGDRAEADDLVQDCLERALAGRAGFRGEGSVQGWMYRILQNLYRDGRRRAARPGHLILVGGEALPDSLPELGRPGGQEAHLALAEVQAAIGRLPPDQRQALLLVALEGLSLAEVARVMAVPEGTLVSRLGRARAALREMTGHSPERRREG